MVKRDVFIEHSIWLLSKDRSNSNLSCYTTVTQLNITRTKFTTSTTPFTKDQLTDHQVDWALATTVYRRKRLRWRQILINEIIFQLKNEYSRFDWYHRCWRTTLVGLRTPAGILCASWWCPFCWTCWLGGTWPFWSDWYGFRSTLNGTWTWNAA